MTPRELLVELGGRRVRVWANRDQLHYAAPKGVLTADDRDALQKHKPSLLKLLGRGGDLLAMKLRQFKGTRCSLEVKVPGLDGTVWFVSGEEEVQTLQAEGVQRGRIWTAPELRALLGASGITQEDTLALARTKVAFDGDVISPRPDDRADAPAEQIVTEAEPDPSLGNLSGKSPQEHER